jgi:hypothetical protein
VKTASLLLVLFCACLLPARAQVSITVTFDQEQFLPGEDLNAIVRISNLSGQTIHIGTEPDWLKFAVASRDDGAIVLKTGEAPVMEKIDLDSAKAVIKRINIAPYFNLKSAGQFSLVATASIKDWNKQISSAPANFDIVNAATLWSKEFGVPQSPEMTNNSPPEVRRYTLLQANHLQRLTLYFQLADSNGKVIKVFPLGRMLNNVPEALVDRFSNLHLLYQIGARSACYMSLSPEGELTLRQTYDFAPRPHLRMEDSNGSAIVIGGDRRPTPNDLPPPKMAEVKTN